MNYSKLKNLLESTLAGERDALFADVLGSMHCMSTARVYAVLNAVVSSMDPGEIYLEVGTYQGGSLVSALLGNGAQAIGVDSFGEFMQTNNFDLTHANLKKFDVADRVILYNMTFQEFFSTWPQDVKIQTYYYDGAHDYLTQLAGMEAAWEYIPSSGIIIVDDFTYPEVQAAVNQFIANHITAIKPLFIMDPVESVDPVWWNGVVALRKIQ